MKHVYEIDDGGERHWYSAESEEAARLAHKKFWYDDAGEDWDEIKDDVLIMQYPDYKPMTVYNEDNDERITKTGAEWANDEHGFIASTCY